MFRRVLTYQLILAVAVGPLLCCCTAGRVLASAAPPPATPASPAYPLASTPRAAAPCCGHAHHSPKASADREPGEPKPAPPKPGGKCPCKDDSGKSATARTEGVSFDSSAFPHTAVFHLLLTQLAVANRTDSPTQDRQWSDTSQCGNAALPSTADLLFAHHNLRC